MHRVLSTIQQISQARLKGIPRIMGFTRSQSGTEKHMAAKGIRARRRAPGDGFFSGTGSPIIACRYAEWSAAHRRGLQCEVDVLGRERRRPTSPPGSLLMSAAP